MNGVRVPRRWTRPQANPLDEVAWEKRRTVISNPDGSVVRLQDVARVSIEDGPPMLRSENARLSGWVYVDVRGRDLRSVVNDMQVAVASQVAMPAGYAVSWSGQFEYLERATERLKLVVPVTLAVIFVLWTILGHRRMHAA